MCGENGSGRSRWLSRVGSSPHVRGKPLLLTSALAPRRLIPARAGKTCAEGRAGPPSRAHPRACGENTGTSGGPSSPYGSSPRVRGKPRARRLRIRPPRLIPARAGKTGWGPLVPGATWAHPRACGENTTSSPHKSCLATSSPRVRGKPVQVRPQVADGRLIPACAGKTRPSATLSPRSPAHPRVCGENAAGAQGSSPRVRGKLRPDHHARRRGRLIPACAGKTACVRHDVPFHTAHPRACGENVVCSAMSFGFPGSSPRVRGKPHRQRQPPDEAGLIPARAGKTGGSVCRSASQAAHPRACGENAGATTTDMATPGSSPRVRGKPEMTPPIVSNAGLIPARAGKTSGAAPRNHRGTAHPRVCGENPNRLRASARIPGSSPRVRGKQQTKFKQQDPQRLIPARAGKTRARAAAMAVVPAHPRACGENAKELVQTSVEPGSSPRVRGKLVLRARGGDCARLIPACAGKTVLAFTSAPSWRAHPRVCGENLGAHLYSLHLGAHPRVCGENAGTHQGTGWARGSSPRVRGKPVDRAVVPTGVGLIPACAGKTSYGSARSSSPRAHPRVCGENQVRR